MARLALRWEAGDASIARSPRDYPRSRRPALILTDWGRNSVSPGQVSAVRRQSFAHRPEFAQNWLANAGIRSREKYRAPVATCPFGVYLFARSRSEEHTSE